MALFSRKSAQPTPVQRKTLLQRIFWFRQNAAQTTAQLARKYPEKYSYDRTTGMLRRIDRAPRKAKS